MPSKLDTRNPVRVLFIEDSPDDVTLAVMAIEDAGLPIEHRVVDSTDALRSALEQERWDVIVSDYRLPGFTGFDALKIVQQFGLDVPFILVSGTVEEDVAVEIMRAGAHDYLLKDRLARLPAAIERELGDARLRWEQRRNEHAQRLVVRASAVLARSLDFETTLAELSRLIVSEAADLCVVEVSEPELGPRWVTVALRDDADARRAEELRSELMARGEPLSARFAEAARPKPVELVARVDAARLAELEQRSGALGWLSRVGARSYLCTALGSSGRVLGSITLVMTRDHRTFDTFDLALARELAWRAAAVVDNARLFRNAQDAIRLRDEFLSVASHELKTPIAAVQLQLWNLRQALTQLSPGCVDESLHERSARLARSLRRLSRLVDSLLDVSRISTGKLKLHPEPIDLAQLAREVIEYLGPDAELANSRLTLTARSACAGQWDFLRIEQVLISLLANALKFGAGHPIEVDVECSEGSAILRVIDHGIGVALEDRERIFGRFERAVPARQYGGLGLGLFVSNQIVQAHGGTIRVVPTEGGGATFEVVLPLTAPPPGS